MKKIYILFAILSLFVLQFSCIDVVRASAEEENVTFQKYNNLNTDKLSCGNGMVNHIPKVVVRTVNIVYLGIQIVVPIILVITGMITLIKSVTAGKDDEIKKAQMAFVKKLVIGAIVFFVFVIVKLLVSLVGDSNKGDVMNCVNCFLNNKGCSSEKASK